MRFSLGFGVWVLGFSALGFWGFEIGVSDSIGFEGS